MHPPAAEPGHLTRREQAGHRLRPSASRPSASRPSASRPSASRPSASRYCPEHPPGQVGLQAAQRLAGQDVEAHGDQRPGLRVQDLVRRRGAGQPLATRAAGVPDGHDLQVLGERVVDLPVARDDLALQVGQLEERLRGQVRFGLLVEQQHPPSGPRQLRGGGQSRQPRAHHDRIRVHLVIKPGHGCAFTPRPGLL
jgi:hypothetical protein